MSLQGLPDFQRPIHGLKYEMYYPYENAGSFIVASSSLEIGRTKTGRPDFLLELVRGISPAAPPKPYALLDFRVKATYPAEDALAQLRRQHPSATVAPPVLRGGFLRMQPAADSGEMSPELLAPVPLSPTGLGVARFAVRLGPASGAIVEGALKGEVLGVLAWAEMEMEGVAPRVPVSVSFDPGVLLGALARLARDPAAPLVNREQLEKFFEQDLGGLPLRVDRALTDDIRRDFIESMSDHVRAYFGEFAASPTTPVEPSIALRMSLGAPGSVTWDLSKPIAVPRAFVSVLDPFDAARQLVSTDGIGAVVKHTIVPPLALGTRRLHVTANLPSTRVGVVTLGVNISAPARPPHRMQAIHQTIELVPPGDSGVVTLRMSAAEPTEYESSTWAVLERSGSIERLQNPAVRRQDETLDLGVEDFPVRFVTVSATAALLDLASLTGVCGGHSAGGAFESRFELNPDQPETGIAVPLDAVLKPLVVEAREKAGPKTLRLSLPTAQSTQLDLPSFEEFGSHRVVIEGDFGGLMTGLLAVDLVAEEREQQADAVETIALTTAVPLKEWHYVAASPFRAGYRYRAHPSSGEPGGPWSDVQLPGATLRISAAVLAGG